MGSLRNIYKDGVDFSALALLSTTFATYLKPNSQLDFSNPEAVKELTKALLKRDFGLDIDLPDNRLCPPVPNRLSYILWIQDLLDTTGPKFIDRYDPSRKVIGLDIGTGASCIYPLLGTIQRPQWTFAATDVDGESLQSAQKNVERNDLHSRIKLLKTKIQDPLIPLDTFHLDRIDFTMCNPPFYESREEMLHLAKEKQRPPNSACTGSEAEMVTPGGEVAFVKCMIEESITLGQRVQWYSSMLGKLSSVSTLVGDLRERGVKNYAVAEFVHGGKTRRWAIAWSWKDMRPGMATARGISSLPKHLLPFPSEFTFSLGGTSIDTVGQQTNSTLHDLNLQWQWKTAMATGVGFAEGNVWSRASRRKQERGERPTEMSDGEGVDPDEAALGFKVQLSASKQSSDVEVNIRWLKGDDTILFESFCGMLKRKLSAA